MEAKMHTSVERAAQKCIIGQARDRTHAPRSHTHTHGARHRSRSFAHRSGDDTN
jgi:hypothetical protein